MHPRIWLALGLAAIGWGTSGPVTRAALAAGIPPVGMTAMRAAIAVVVITTIVYATDRRYPTDRPSWTLGAMMGTVNLALPFVATVIALQYASSGFVGLLIALTPLATALLAHYLLPDEPLQRAKITGLGVAFAGVGLLLVSGDSGLASGGRPLLAAALTVTAVIGISYGAIYAKQRQASFDPIVLTGMQFLVGVVLMVPMALVVEGVPDVPSAWGVVLLLYLGVAGSVLPFLMFYWVLQRTSVTNASLVAYVVPLISLSTGIVFLDERLDLGIAIGGALILTGVLLIDRIERGRSSVTVSAGPAH